MGSPLVSISHVTSQAPWEPGVLVQIYTVDDEGERFVYISLRQLAELTGVHFNTLRERCSSTNIVAAHLEAISAFRGPETGKQGRKPSIFITLEDVGAYLQKWPLGDESTSEEAVRQLESGQLKSLPSPRKRQMPLSQVFGTALEQLDERIAARAFLEYQQTPAFKERIDALYASVEERLIRELTPSIVDRLTNEDTDVSAIIAEANKRRK
jgi:hypothetical protein